MKNNSVIEIKIKDNLTKEQEVVEIAKQLAKKKEIGTSQKLIGSNIELQHLETTIKIVRTPSEKPLETKECSCCGTIFELKYGYRSYTNYGGVKRTIKFCSKFCAETAVKLIGARLSINSRAKNVNFKPFF